VLSSSKQIAEIDTLLALLALFIFMQYLREPLLCRFMQFLAILGINREIGRLRIVKNYLFILAGVVYYIQVLGIKKLLLVRGRNNQTKADRKNFIKMRKKYLVDRLFSPISKIINLLVIGKHIRLNAGNSSNIY
jgi:hypothetical protein